MRISDWSSDVCSSDLVSLKVFVGRPAELERNSMTSKLMEEPRIDPRIKAMFGSADPMILPNVSSREELLAQENSNTADVSAANLQVLLDAMGSEEVVQSAGRRSEEGRVGERCGGK